MKELFNVRFHPNGDGFEMDMVNGTLDVPDKKGCYVLSTGCGSGKTECCKSIIRQRANDGILYCVDTIAELDKMYQWIASHGMEFGVRPDDVIIISSDGRHQQYLHQYQNSPEILMTKKVVLITHVRFWTDLVNYFLIYNPTSKIDAFDGDFKSLMSRSDLRKYVIFDETPRFIQPFFSMPKPFLSSFCNQDSEGNYHCCDGSEIRMRHNHFFKDHPLNPFPKANTAISEIKRGVIFKLIPEYFDRWINSKDEVLEIAFTPLNLSEQKVNTHVIVLEGAGNVLFENSNYYTLIDVENKYNCRVQFSPFQFTLKRRDDNFDYNSFNNFLTWCNDHLLKNQAMGKRTLVVVWKNFGKKTMDSKSTDYYDMVVRELSKNPYLFNTSYRVIYYGSSESKSTNEFRDFNEIVLAGKWSLPNTDTQKFKTSFGVEIDNERHRLWAFVQLLCRIGIRLHDGKDYSVYYSSDFPEKFICSLKDYLENKELIPLEVQDSAIPDWLEDRFDRAKIRLNHRAEIIKLCEQNEFLLDALQRESNYSPKIPMEELFEIVPRDRKKRGRYSKLLAALKKLGIKLEIT